MRAIVLFATAFAATLLAVAAAPLEAGVVSTQVVRGRLVATDDDSDAAGFFRMTVKTFGDSTRESFDVDAGGLDTTRDGDGNLPDYHAVLVTADGGTEADFGEVFLGATGRVRLRFRSARDSFPSGATTLLDFAGGTVELRLDDSAILTGDVPDFLGIGDENGAGSGAAAAAVGVKRLRVTADGGDAKGAVTAAYANRPRVQVEALRVECRGLGTAGDVFTVVVIDDEGTETELGTMTSRTRYAVAVLALSSRRGDTIPGGGVLALGGQKVEVRDAGGTAWLIGRFPDLVAE